MKTLILTAFAALTIGSAALASDLGYDRPGPENTQKDGHEHVVYWSSFYDHLSFDVQDAADAHYSTSFPKKTDTDYKKKHDKDHMKLGGH
jgi:hypothetical protein